MTQKDFWRVFMECHKTELFKSFGGLVRQCKTGACPITAVAKRVTDVRWSPMAALAAADSIGLRQSFASEIIDAADDDDANMREKLLRKLRLTEDQK